MVKLGDRYLADRFYHTAWTNALFCARLFLTEHDATKAAALTKGAEIALVQLMEIE